MTDVPSSDHLRIQGLRIQGLSAMLAKQDTSKPAPVEQWDPPYCGDIGMAIKADGTWFYQGSPIGRKPMVQLFARVLRKDADGCTYLVTPVEKIDVAVDDAPFLAVEMETQGTGSGRQLIFRTNVDDVVRVGPEHPIRFEVEAGSGGLKPYIRVRGRLEALVTRALTFDLVELAEEDGDGRLGIRSGGALFMLPAEDGLDAGCGT